MSLRVACLLLLSVGVAVGDKSEGLEAVSSYSAPVGSSYSVPLTASYSAPKPASSVSYSVSASDLDRSDLSVSASHDTPVYKTTHVGSSYGTASLGYGSSLGSSASVVESAPAAAAPKSDSVPLASSYKEPTAPSSGYEAQQPVSTGNLYYYYYPVAAHPIAEKTDTEEDDIDTLLLILVPIVILLGGISLLNAAGVITFNGRSFGRQSPLDAAFGTFADLQAELDAMLEKYYDALDSESCMDRTVCELGTKASDISGKEWLISALDWVIPAQMSHRVATFKEAAREGYDVHACRKYHCEADKIIQARRN